MQHLDDFTMIYIYLNELFLYVFMSSINKGSNSADQDYIRQYDSYWGLRCFPYGKNREVIYYPSILTCLIDTSSIQIV